MYKEVNSTELSSLVRVSLSNLHLASMTKGALTFVPTTVHSNGILTTSLEVIRRRAQCYKTFCAVEIPTIIKPGQKRYKHSNLLPAFINYSRKFFYNICTRFIHKHQTRLDRPAGYKHSSLLQIFKYLCSKFYIIGAWPYPQILRLAITPCPEEILNLILNISKLQP